MGKYDDIIQLPHHVSSRRKHMSNYERAAQFSPFAALTGYEDIISETARLTDERVELSDEYREAIERKLQKIYDNLEEDPEVNPEVNIVYFSADEKKSGGKYITVSGRIKYVDEIERTIAMRGGDKIYIDDIYGVEIVKSGEKADD
ncbi:MAG: hypothetical protein IJR55_05225 [Clostridia bacterium]|nr:hypothetical protein [Clostridia bacterium]